MAEHGKRPRHAEVALAFHVGQLLGDLPITHAKDVNASHVPWPAVAQPGVFPENDAAIVEDSEVLGFEVSLGRALKEVFPKPAYGGVTGDARPVGRGAGVLEHAILGHAAHDRVHIMAIEGLVELLDNRACRLGHGVSLTRTLKRALYECSSEIS
jgi:hypothetical protein